MANYGYVQLSKKRAITLEVFEKELRSAVLDVLGDRWVVASAPWDHDGPTYLVTVPGTAEENSQVWGPTDEDVGWTASLESDRTIAFRHGPLSEFARWAQGCIEEELAERLKGGLYYDAGFKYKSGHREYRKGKTLREYLLRNFPNGPENAEHEAFLERLARGTPKGFWP